MKLFRRRAPLILLAGALLGAGGALYAQLEGADRGVPPIDSSSTLEVTGIEVDASGKTSEEARLEGWRQAQRLGWAALWANSTGRPASQAPDLSDSVLNTIVSGIIIEQEQIGPKRYIARLGLLFDRSRAGQMLGGGQGVVRRSAPMLVIPVMQTGSTLYSLEFRNEWQKAWARFRTGGSAIDYVRPTGSGVDPLLLNAAQTHRPGRAWWRILIDGPAATGPVPVGAASAFSIQVDTPSAAAVSQAELSVSRINGVTSALTTSLALGGTSVMRVTFVGDSAALQAALQAQGWTVQGSGNTLRITRPGGQ